MRKWWVLSVSVPRHCWSWLGDRSLLFHCLQARALKSSEDLFVHVHLSDQNPLGFGGVGGSTQGTTPSGSSVTLPGAVEYRKLLRFKFYLPTSPLSSGEGRGMELLRPLVATAIHLIDRVATRQLSPQAKAKALNLRKQVQENLNRQTQAARQEARARRKEELKADGNGAQAGGAGAGAGGGAGATATTETHTRVLTKEQQRKKEEKERLAQLKRKQPRLKV